MPTEDENLPTIIPKSELQSLNLNGPTDLQHNAIVSEAIKADVQVANDMLKLCYAGLGKAQSLSTLLKAVSTTMSVIEKRRHILNLPYGHSDSDSRDNTLEPLD